MNILNLCIKTYNQLVIKFKVYSFFCNKTSNFISWKINSNWQFNAINDTLWLKADVPISVQTNLISNKIIEDPFYHLNEHDLQWIDKKDWNVKQFLMLIMLFIIKKK